MKTHDPFEELFRKGLGNQKLTPPAGLWDKIDSQVNPVPLEDAFRTGMQGKAISPPPNIWARIEQELERNKPRIVWMWYHSAAAALFMASLLAGAFWFNHAQDKSAQFAEKRVPTAVVTQEENTPTSSQNAASVVPVQPEQESGTNSLTAQGTSGATSLPTTEKAAPRRTESPENGEASAIAHNPPTGEEANIVQQTPSPQKEYKLPLAVNDGEENIQRTQASLIVLEPSLPASQGNLVALYVPAVSQTASAEIEPPKEPKAKGNSRFNFYIGAGSGIASYNPRLEVLQPSQILSGHDGSDFAPLMERATGVSHTHSLQTELGLGKVFFRTGLGQNTSLFRLESTALNDTTYAVDPGLDPLGRDSISRTDRYVHTLEIRQQSISIPAMLGIRLGKKRLQAVLASGVVWQQALGQRVRVNGEMPYAYQLPTAQSRLDLRTEVGLRYAVLQDRLFIQVSGQYQNALQEIYRDTRMSAQPQQLGVNGQLLLRLK